MNISKLYVRVISNSVRRFCNREVTVKEVNILRETENNRNESQILSNASDQQNTKPNIIDTSLSNEHDVDLGTIKKTKYGTIVVTIDPKKFPENATVLSIEDLNIAYANSSIFQEYCKAEVSFNTEYAYWLDTETKKQLLAQNKQRLNKDGFLVFSSDGSASRKLNLQDCIKQLRETIAAARNVQIQKIVITDMHKIFNGNI